MNTMSFAGIDTGRSPYGERGLKYHHIADREHGLVALLTESVD